MKKHIFGVLMAVFVLLAVLSVHALASEASATDEIQLAKDGTVTLLSGHAAGEGVSSLQFQLTVEPPADTEANVKLTFAEGLETDTRILSASYSGDTKILNVYVSGTDALIQGLSNSVVIGQLSVEDGNGEPVTAQVSVVQASLKYVYGTNVRTQNTPVATLTLNAGPTQAFTDLTQLVDTVKSLDAKGYTSESYAPLKTALEKAEALLKDKNATDEQLVAAKEELEAAMKALVPVASQDSRNALQNAVTLAEGFLAKDYTTASFKTLTDAITAAKAVLANTDATDAMMNEQVTKLNEAISALVHVASAESRENLETALEAALALLGKEDYTEETYQALQEAIAAAQTALADRDSTDADLAAALDRLQAAIKGLVIDTSEERAALSQALASARALPEFSYTSASYAVLKEAMAAAGAALAKEDATEQELREALRVLEQAILNLVPVATEGTRNALAAELAEAKALQSSDYTEETYQVLAEAMETAEKVLANRDATEAEMTEALEALRKAVAGLKRNLAAEQDALKAALEAAKALKESDYTAASYQKLKEAIAAAEAALADENATKESLTGAAAKLAEAVAGLLPKAKSQSKEALQAALAAAQALQKDYYTAATYEALAQAMADAQAILSSADPAETEIAAVYAQLRAAVAGLTVDTTAERQALKDAIAAAEALESTGYSAESFAALQAQIQAAKDVLAEESATKEALQAAYKALSAALSGLQPVSQEDSIDNLTATLKTRLMVAEALQKENYTAESYQALSNAITGAKNALNLPPLELGEGTDDATRENNERLITERKQLLQGALQVLNAAISDLKEDTSVEREALQKAVDAAKTLKETDYTVASFASLKSAIAAAENVLTDDSATREVLTAAYTALYKAVAGLEPQATQDSREALGATIRSAEALQKADYTPASYQALESALAAAKVVYADETASEEALQNALNALRSAISALVVDTTAQRNALSQAIASAEALSPVGYTQESFAALQEALNQAREVLADENATKEALIAAYDALARAVENLVSVPVTDSSATLAATLAAAKALQENNYTPESYAALLKAIAEAEAVLAKEDATEEEIAAALANLQAAIAALEERMTASEARNALAEAVKKAKEIKKDGYTEESYRALQEAIKAAEEVLANPDATLQELEDALNALIAAVKGLEGLPPIQVDPVVPPTGDEAPLGLMVVLLVLSGSMIALMAKRRRVEER